MKVASFILIAFLFLQSCSTTQSSVDFKLPSNNSPSNQEQEFIWSSKYGESRGLVENTMRTVAFKVPDLVFESRKQFKKELDLDDQIDTSYSIDFESVKAKDMNGQIVEGYRLVGKSKGSLTPQHLNHFARIMANNFDHYFESIGLSKIQVMKGSIEDF